MAKTAAEFGFPYFLSTVANRTPEEIGPITNNKGWFQLYPPRDLDLRRDLLARAKESGFNTLLITSDVPISSRRERQKLAGITIPPKISPITIYRSVIRGGLNGSTQHFILNEEMECMQMTRRNGRGFSSAEKTELWDRWQRGESLKAIGRVFGKPSSSIYFQLSPHGGIRPSPRRRSRLALSLWEREEISRGIVARHSIRSMALLLSRSPSTVSREVRRNGGYDQYRAALADDMAWARARRPKRCKLALSSGMRRVVAMKLGLNWSPEQIAGWLKRAHPGAGSYQVSHETIYRSLFVQARGVLKKELLQHLRSKRTIRRSERGAPERRWPGSNHGHGVDP